QFVKQHTLLEGCENDGDTGDEQHHQQQRDEHHAGGEYVGPGQYRDVLLCACAAVFTLVVSCLHCHGHLVVDVLPDVFYSLSFPVLDVLFHCDCICQASFSAILIIALRARGLPATSPAPALTALPTLRIRGFRSAYCTGTPAGKSSPRTCSAMNCLTMRSSSE